MAAQAAAEPIPKVDLELSLLQEVSSDITEISSSTGLSYPTAVSFQAGDFPARSAVAPDSVKNWDAHSTKRNGSAIARDLGHSHVETTAASDAKSHNEDPSTDEYREFIIPTTVDVNPVLGSNKSISAESTPLSSWKKSTPSVENITNEIQGSIETLTPGKSRAMSIAPQSDPKKENELPGKGKAIDPCNWGLLDVLKEELNPEIQQQLLEGTNAEVADAPMGHLKDRIGGETVDSLATLDAEPDSDIEIKQELLSCEELKQYIQNKHKLAKELARFRQKQKTTHNKKECTGLVPVSDKLSRLIGQVTESKEKIQSAKRDSHSLLQAKDVMKPFAQVTNKCALGKAFWCLRNADGGRFLDCQVPLTSGAQLHWASPY
ncbi:hypothetical protein H2248_006359 [Termitomyces sp. 'cryptogamus']|nr:hypothetical protein H2248_006359 [Termitomyces sp. 'cryptogamus']